MRTTILKPARPMSDREIARLSRRHPTLRFERSPEGALIVAPPAGFDTDARNGELIGQLYVWNSRAKLGVVLGSSAGFSLSIGALYSPDAAWVTNERVRALPPEERAGFPHLCPDAVFEVRSKSDRLLSALHKLHHYIDAGARLAVLVDPYERTVHALFGGSHEAHIFRDLGKLRFIAPDGEEVLPGFELDAEQIFRLP